METTKSAATVVSKVLQGLSQSKAQSPTVVSKIEITLTCPKCGRDRVVLSDKHSPGRYASECRECEQARREQRFVRTCPPLYQESDVARLPQHKLRQALAWQYGPQGLILIGETGVCKTRIAWQLIRRVLVNDKREVSFTWFDAVGFGHELAKHYHQEDAETWLEKITATELMFFDDLGKLKLTERAETELFGLIERRCAACLPMIVTTNDTGDSLAARMTENRGPAMIRRLREFCSTITF